MDDLRSILLQGAQVWNDWRNDNFITTFDLVGINLEGIDLSGADLKGADLTFANLSKANLSNTRMTEVKLNLAKLNDADLRSAHLPWARLVNADLSGANLEEANLAGADLQFAKLKGTNLEKTQLVKANLSGRDLREVHSMKKAILESANLSRANLSGVNLEEVMLAEADLRSINLEGTYIVGANLGGADLRGASLVNANLYKSNLTNADLRNADLQGANLTGVELYGTARFNWKIGGIKCDYIYFNKKKNDEWEWSEGEERIREPRNRDFEPGEFERIHKSAPTVEIVFENGMNFLDPALLAYIAEESKETRPNLQLALRTIELKGIHPSAVFEIAAENLKDKAEEFVRVRHQEISNDKNTIQGLITTVQTLSDNNRELIKTNQKLTEMLPSNKKVINVSGGSYYENSTHTESISGNKITARNIENVGYVSSLGISEEQFDELKNAVVLLRQDTLDEIKRVIVESQNKEAGGESIELILSAHGVDIAKGIVASVLFEIMKMFLL